MVWLIVANVRGDGCRSACLGIRGLLHGFRKVQLHLERRLKEAASVLFPSHTSDHHSALDSTAPLEARAYLEVWREVAVSFVFIGLVQVVLGERQDEVVPVAFPAAVPALSARRLTLAPLLALHVVHRPVLHLVPAVLWSRDEEGVHPEVEHFVLKARVEKSGNEVK